MGKVPIKSGLIAGVIVAVSLVASLFLYSSLPAVTSSSQGTNASLSSSPRPAGTPFANPGFLISPSGCAASSLNGTAYAEPCSFAGTIKEAKVFDCLAEAALPSGCTDYISGVPKTTPAPPPINGSPNSNFGSSVPVLNNTVTVWYPYVDHTGKAPTWANCMFQVGHLYSGSPYGFCISLNSTAFIVSGPALVLPPE